jgi:hypothetical protein
VLATAQAAYTTNAALDATKVAARYGLTVSGDGVGAAAVSAGGDAFGVGDDTLMGSLNSLDWFFASNLDMLKNQRSDETVTPIF